MDKLDLDRKRAVIDVLLRVTILPGQRRGELRTELLPITWKGLKMIALRVIWFVALKVIWSIVLMFFTLVVAALAGWLVAGIACVLAREVLRAATAEFPQLATTIGGVGNFPSSTLPDAEIATLEAEAEAAVP